MIESADGVSGNRQSECRAGWRDRRLETRFTIPWLKHRERKAHTKKTPNVLNSFFVRAKRCYAGISSFR